MKAVFWFTNSNKLGGLLIRKGLMFKYNHVGIEIDDVVYDATFMKGVVKQSVDDFMEGYAFSEGIVVDVPNPKEFKAFLETQVGKPYDWRAIIAFPLRKTWEKEHAWHCSELATKAAIVGGVIPRTRIPKSSISPRDLYLMLPRN